MILKQKEKDIYGCCDICGSDYFCTSNILCGIKRAYSLKGKLSYFLF